MKQRTAFLPLLCTALLAALGLALPPLTALGLDRRLAQDVLVREDTPISLVLAADTGPYDALTLFGAAQTMVPLPEGARRDALAVRKAAEQLKFQLDALVWERPASFSGLPEAEPYLVTSGESPARSGIFWRCAWPSEDGREEILWLDDQTGQLTGFFMRTPSVSLAVREDGEFGLVEAVVSIPDAVVNTADFLRRHYGADTQTLNVRPDFADSFALLLTGPEPDASASLSLRMAGGYLAYNL